MAKLSNQIDTNRIKLNFNNFRYDHFELSEQQIIISKSNKRTSAFEFLLFTDDRDNQAEIETELRLFNKTNYRNGRSEIHRHINNFGLTAIVIAEYSQDAYRAFLKFSKFRNVSLMPLNRNANCLASNQQRPEELLQSQDNHIAKLCDSCLLNLFSYLDVKTLFEVALVCTQFRNVARMDARIKRIRKYHFIFGTRLSNASCCPQDWKRIREVEEMRKILNCIGIYVNEIVLELPQGAEFNEFFIIDTMVGNVGTNLRTVHFKYFRWLTVIFEHLLSPNHMQVIHSYSSRSNVRTTFPNLEALALYDNGKLVNVSNWTNILELNLEYSRRCNWGRFLESASLNTPNMRKLVLTNETLTSNQFVYLLNLKNLRELDINVGDSECFDILLQMPELTGLSIIFPDNLIMGHRYFELARHMKDLEHFHLKEAFQSSARDFFKFISLATKLKSFHIDHCGAPTTIDYILLNEILEARKKSQINVTERSRLQFSIYRTRLFQNACKILDDPAFEVYITATTKGFANRLRTYNRNAYFANFPFLEENEDNDPFCSHRQQIDDLFVLKSECLHSLELELV